MDENESTREEIRDCNRESQSEGLETDLAL